MKKSKKLIFCGKNDAQISSFGVVKKAPSQGSEKLFFTTKLLIKREQQKIKKMPLWRKKTFWRKLSHKSSRKISVR